MNSEEPMLNFNECTKWRNQTANEVEKLIQELDSKRPILITYDILEGVLRGIKTIVDKYNVSHYREDIEQNKLTEEQMMVLTDRQLILNELVKVGEQYGIDLNTIKTADCPPCLKKIREMEEEAARNFQEQKEMETTDYRNIDGMLNSLDTLDETRILDEEDESMGDLLK